METDDDPQLFVDAGRALAWRYRLAARKRSGAAARYDLLQRAEELEGIAGGAASGVSGHHGPGPRPANVEKKTKKRKKVTRRSS